MAGFIDKVLNTERKLGVAENAARYDLPLHNCAGSGFLMLLVALMSFLAMMALTGSFVLHGVSARWEAGLVNQATIEIPARRENGKIRTPAQIDALSQRISGLLDSHPNVREHTILSREDVGALVSPWLGDGIAMDDMPLPGLISSKLKVSSAPQVKALSAALHTLNEDIRLDTHESWLGDILRLAGSLKLAAGFVTLVIGLTTVIAIGGAVRSRMAEFRSDIELLHLMGASPDYISKQFQRHNVRIALKGSLMGLAVGGLGLVIFGALSRSTQDAALGVAQGGLVPHFSLSFVEILGLLSLSGFACLIAFITARFTALRTLSLLA